MDKSLMLRMFWTVLMFQMAMVMTVAIQWPQDKMTWYISGFVYLVSSLLLLYLGLQIAKEKKAYYLITIASTSFNWVLFGILGTFISFLVSLIKFSGA
jgi:hypothetical protein